MSFNSERLVTQITLKGSLPDGRFSDQELLDLAYDSLLSEIVPMVIEAREDYFVTHQDFTVTANQAAYFIPARAINGVVREVQLIKGTQVVDLPRINSDDVKTTTSGDPQVFYTSGNSIYLYPTPDTTQYTLRVSYFIRPSRLVSTAECARITGIAGNVLSVTLPNSWTTANTFDLVRGRAHFDILDIDLSASSVTSNAITLSATPPSTLAVGDYITLSEETCFPFLPPEGHVALVQCAVTSALESMGDASSQLSAQKAEMLKTKFANVLKTRVEGQPKALGNRLL